METRGHKDMNRLKDALLSSDRETFNRTAEETPLQQQLNLFKAQNASKETILHELAGVSKRNRILWVLELLNQEDRRKLCLIRTSDGQTVFHLLAYSAQLSLILLAFKTMNVSAITQLLECTNADGDTIAHCIAKCGSRRSLLCLTEILEMVPSEAILTILKLSNNSKLTVFHLCIQNNDFELASCFVKRVPEQLRRHLFKQQTPKGQTVMHMAVEKNDAGLLQQLLDLLPTSAKSPILALKTRKSERTAVNLAVKRDFIECIRVLVPYSPCNSDLLLHQAARYGNADAFRAILGEMGKEHRIMVLKHQNENGSTPLHIAVQQQSLEIVSGIVENIPNKECLSLFKVRDNNGETALHHAVDLEQAEILQEMLEALNLEERTSLMSVERNGDKCKAMHLAARNKRWPELRILIQMVQNSHLLVEMITEQNSKGDTVFQGLLDGHKELAKFLINSLSTQDRLDILAKVPDQIVKILLDLIAFTSSEAQQLATTLGVDGNAFLHICARHNHYEATNRFLSRLNDADRGTALHFHNRNGKSPRKLAQKSEMKSFLVWAKKQTGHYYLPKPPEIIILCSTINREGANVECDSLEQVLKQFRLQPTIWRDLNADEMLSKIRDAASKEGNSGLMVVATGHGRKGAICAKDEDLRFQDILSSMCNPAMEGKPKILLAQSCQGREAVDGIRLSDHKGNKGLGGAPSDPAPGATNVPAQTELRQIDRVKIQQIVKHFFDQNGATKQLTVEVFDRMIPEGTPNETRAAIWTACNDLLASLHRINASFRGEKKDGQICSSSDTDKKHYDLLQRDIMSIMATVNGGTAFRGVLIPTFAKYLKSADANEDLYNVFLKTHEELARDMPEQVSEFRSTLTKKLCLRNIIDCPANQRSGTNNSLQSSTHSNRATNFFRRLRTL